MARPRCFECGRKLMYVKGKPVFVVYTDPIGIEHKLHKNCARYGDYDKKTVKTGDANAVAC